MTLSSRCYQRLHRRMPNESEGNTFLFLLKAPIKLTAMKSVSLQFGPLENTSDVNQATFRGLLKPYKTGRPRGKGTISVVGVVACQKLICAKCKSLSRARSWPVAEPLKSSRTQDRVITLRLQSTHVGGILNPDWKSKSRMKWAFGGFARPGALLYAACRTG